MIYLRILLAALGVRIAMRVADAGCRPPATAAAHPPTQLVGLPKLVDGAGILRPVLLMTHTNPQPTERPSASGEFAYSPRWYPVSSWGVGR